MKTVRAVLFILLAALVMLEIALRITTFFPADSAAFVRDPDIGYRMRPHLPIRDSVTTNAFGFNDIDHARQPTSPRRRIAIIGDSFVFGAVPRDQVFTAVLQEHADRAGAAVDVLNMGLPAAGPRTYLGLLEHDAVAMNADLVCVVFFVGNDIIQSHPDFNTMVWLGAPRDVLTRPYVARFSKDYFYVYRVMRLASRMIQERLDQTPRPSWTQATFLSIEYQRSEIFRTNKRAYIEESYEAALNTLKHLSDKARQLGKAFVVVLAPDELQVDQDLQAALAEEYKLTTEHYNYKEPQNIITNALRKADISVIDLFPSFQEAERQEDLYITNDTHWNIAGNRLAAEIIWRYLNTECRMSRGECRGAND